MIIGDPFHADLPKNLPIIYTISKAVVKERKVYITYQGIDEYLITETEGSIYFDNGIVGVFSKGDNHY